LRSGMSSFRIAASGAGSSFRILPYGRAAPNAGTVRSRIVMEGSIRKLVNDRGFGFIRTQGGKDVFFHRSGIVEGNFDELEVGQNVSFEVEESARGPRARNVRIVGA